jgi:hypothetical protein
MDMGFFIAVLCKIDVDTRLDAPAWDYSAQVLYLVDGRSRAVFGKETEKAESGEVEEVQMEG